MPADRQILFFIVQVMRAHTSFRTYISERHRLHLQVCQDDEVVVNVHNELADYEGTSIHWHGILQEGTPHMDGVAMVTQCPIPVHSAFQYK